MTKSIATLLLLGSILICQSCHTSQTNNKNTSTRSLSTSPFQGYVCNGNEPFWNIKVEADKITFRQLGEATIEYPYQAPSKSSQLTRFETSTKIEGKESFLIITLEEKQCTDNMSGEKSPYTVRINKDGKTLQGCGSKL